MTNDSKLLSWLKLSTPTSSNLLDPRFKLFKFNNLPNEFGIAPLRWLAARDHKISMLDKFPSETGIGP